MWSPLPEPGAERKLRDRSWHYDHECYSLQTTQLKRQSGFPSRDNVTGPQTGSRSKPPNQSAGALSFRTYTLQPDLIQMLLLAQSDPRHFCGLESHGGKLSRTWKKHKPPKSQSFPKDILHWWHTGGGSFKLIIILLLLLAFCRKFWAQWGSVLPLSELHKPYLKSWEHASWKSTQASSEAVL